MRLIAVLTTLPNRDAARQMARAIVERRLAACAQISEIESFYIWDGALRHEPEWRIVFKTTGERWREIEAAIRELHVDDVAAIVALPVDHAAADYAAWVVAQSSMSV